MSASRSDFFRIPRTFNERRAFEDIIVDEYNGELVEFRVHIRGSRRPSSLPNDWDDIFRSRRGRTWKNNGSNRRIAQWM